MAGVAPTWGSAAAMRRLGRLATLTAVAALAFGLIALLLEIPLAIPAFIIGTTAVVIALFSVFRASHLRDIDAERRGRDQL